MTESRRQRSSFRRILGASAFIATFIAAPCVRADEADALDKQARALMREGEKAFQAGKLADADSAYTRAFAMKPGFDIAANLAEVELAEKKYARAADHYRYAIKGLPASFDPEIKRGMREKMDEAVKHVGRVRVTVNHDGATVRVDAESAGKSPLGDVVFVEPGKHVVRADLVGFTSAEQQVDSAVGAEAAVKLDLIAVDHPVGAKPNLKPTAIAVGVVGGGALIAGSVLLGLRPGVMRQADDEYAAFVAAHGTNCSADQSACDHQDNLRRRQVAFFNAGIPLVAGGGAAVITAVLLGILDPAPTASIGSPPPKVSIRVEPYGTGLQVLGQF